jgi:hypothetical protein
MWWAETSTTLPNWLGLNCFFMDDGIHLSGELDHAGGDLWAGSLSVDGFYVLSPARMPGGTQTRFVSAPVCDLLGQVIGFTGNSGFLGIGGDQWSKCWLHVSQFVHHGIVPGPIAQATTGRNLIFLEDDVDYQETSLPGFLGFPPVEFDLDRSREVIVHTQVRFDFQLEGDSEFRFGGVGHMNPAILRQFQWKLQPK